MIQGNVAILLTAWHSENKICKLHRTARKSQVRIYNVWVTKLWESGNGIQA